MEVDSKGCTFLLLEGNPFAHDPCLNSCIFISFTIFEINAKSLKSQFKRTQEVMIFYELFQHIRKITDCNVWNSCFVDWSGKPLCCRELQVFYRGILMFPLISVLHTVVSHCSRSASYWSKETWKCLSKNLGALSKDYVLIN